MEAPKFIMCPECHEKYDDWKKRRIIDSCGHPRCFSCLFFDNPCVVCEKLLRGRSRSWISSRESLQSTEEDQDMKRCNRASNGFLTKEQYLRTLYSYNPGSQENMSQPKGLGSRRASLDITVNQNRRMNLGRYSASALVLPTVSQKPGLYACFSKESISVKSDVGRYSIPSPSKDLNISKEFSVSTHSLSSSPGSLRRCFDEIIEDDKVFKTNDERCSVLQFQVTSPRSSGYCSEMENYSDQETGLNNTKHAELSSKAKKSVRELAIIDGVLSGNSSAWENTKALFRTTNLKRTNAEETLSEGKSEREKTKSDQTRRHSAPEWHFRKFLDGLKKRAHTPNMKDVVL